MRLLESDVLINESERHCLKDIDKAQANSVT